MKKIKIINTINLAIEIVLFFAVFAVNLTIYFNRIGFTFACFMLAISGVINLIFACIKEASVLTYDTKRYTLVCYASHVILGVGLYYLGKHIEEFYKLQLLYWMILILAIIIPIVVVYLLNFMEAKKKKQSSKGPKFIINK